MVNGKIKIIKLPIDIENSLDGDAEPMGGPNYLCECGNLVCGPGGGGGSNPMCMWGDEPDPDGPTIG